MENEILQLQLTFGAAIVLTAVALFLYARHLRRRRLREERSRDAFVEALLRAAENSTLSDVARLEDLYLAHFHLPKATVGDYYTLADLLRRVLLRISAAHPSSSEHKLSEQLPSLEELLQMVSERLEALERVVPFFGTPHPERELLEDILALANSDQPLLQNRLNRLAEVIKIREDTVQLLGQEKGQARRLARWGLVGTVLFGLLSLLMALWKASAAG